VLCCAVLCCAVLCCAVLCRAMLQLLPQPMCSEPCEGQVIEGERIVGQMQAPCWCAGGRQLILYGGEGHEMIDGAHNQAPNVYTLDVSSLTWHRRSTSCTSLEHSPGVRSLHIATVSQQE